MTPAKNTPYLKRVKPINFLFFRVETTVNQLDQFFWVAPELFKEAITNNLTITGPVHWHYFNFLGDLEKPFTLEISLPVSEVVNDYDGKFHFKRTSEFKCISLVHEGNWLDLPNSYAALMKFVQAENLKPAAVNRELYINADFNFPDANTTEVQMGII